MNIKITNYCIFTNNSIVVNNDVLVYFESTDFDLNTKKIYKNLNIDYPKFYKMDCNSKLGFITVEVLKQSTFEFSEDTCVTAYSKAGSLDTDKKFHETIKNSTDFYPSPAIFVYTLANIVIGEICIRNKIKGENFCFISEKFDINESIEFIETLLQDKVASTALLLWVNYDSSEKYECFSFVLNKETKDHLNSNYLTFNKENLTKLINNGRTNS